MKARKEKKTYSSGAWYFLAPAVIVLFLVGIFPLALCGLEFAAPVHPSESQVAGEHPWESGRSLTRPLSGLETTRRCSRTNRSERRCSDFAFPRHQLADSIGTRHGDCVLLHKPGNEWLKKINRVALVIPLATTLLSWADGPPHVQPRFWGAQLSLEFDFWRKGGLARRSEPRLYLNFDHGKLAVDPILRPHPFLELDDGSARNRGSSPPRNRKMVAHTLEGATPLYAAGHNHHSDSSHRGYP